jgi:hypothetical protein
MTIRFGPGTTISGFQHPGGGGGGGGGSSLIAPTTATTDPFGGSGPSWVFNGNTSGQIATVADNGLAVTNGDPWCVEGFFYQNDNNSFPRVFSIGQYPTTSIAISLEGNTMYYWMNGGVAATAGKPTTLYWHHFAFASNGAYTYMYLDGQALGVYGGTMPDLTGGTLVVGNETPAGGVDTAFGGFMNSFRWTVGNQVYPGGSFTVPTAALGTTQDAGTNINAITSGQVKLIY